MTWSDEDLYDYEPDELEEEDSTPCRICRKLIGDEVGYGDNWGEGPVCECCAGMCGHKEHQYEGGNHE